MNANIMISPLTIIKTTTFLILFGINTFLSPPQKMRKWRIIHIHRSPTSYEWTDCTKPSSMPELNTKSRLWLNSMIMTRWLEFRNTHPYNFGLLTQAYDLPYCPFKKSQFVTKLFQLYKKLSVKDKVSPCKRYGFALWKIRFCPVKDKVLPCER